MRAGCLLSFCTLPALDREAGRFVRVRGVQRAAHPQAPPHQLCSPLELLGLGPASQYKGSYRPGHLQQQ